MRISELSNHQMQIEYKKDLLNIKGEWKCTFIRIKKMILNIIFQNQRWILNFDTLLEIKKNPFQINFLNYKKDENKKLEIIVVGNKNLSSNQISLKKISNL